MRWLLAALGLGVTACAALPGSGPGLAGDDESALPPGVSAKPRAGYRPDRRDYFAFRAAHPGVLEPNYLPYMVHRFAQPGPEGDLLLLCRWPDERLPLRVWIEPPGIPETLQDEFHPIAPSAYVAGVARALDTWQSELGEPAALVRARDEASADLRVRLVGARAPVPRPDVVVLGSTEELLRACRPLAWDPDAEWLRVEFELSEMSIYVADEHGLLTPGQVERVALHEFGHALGMLGHSPDPRDLMYAAYRERSDVETLSQADVSSFATLYALPNGVPFGRVARGAPPPLPPPFPPSGAPLLGGAPVVDAVRGFSLRVPSGWLVADSARGVFAANGPTWDYDASIELAVWPYASLETFLARYGPALLRGGWFRRREATRVAGWPATRFTLESRDGGVAREFHFVELGDGRLLMIVSQAPILAEDEWAPWFAASLATLEITREGEVGKGWR